MSLQAWNDETKIFFHDSFERIVSRPNFCPETRGHGRKKKKKRSAQLEINEPSNDRQDV